MNATFGSELIDVPGTERLFSHHLAKTAGLHLKTLRSIFALQPGLDWSSVGSSLTNQPPAVDMLDPSGFLIK